MSQFLKLQPAKQQVITITGGKGGVGKTNTAVNLAIAQAMLGERVYLLDADFGLSNIDIVLGLKPNYTILDVIEHRCELKDIILQGPFGTHIIPSASGILRMLNLQPLEYAGLISALGALSQEVDSFIIDTAAGVSDSVIRFALAADELIIVLCNEPTSLADAYSLIKILNQHHHIKRFKILVNMASSLKESKEIFAKLTNVADKYLNVSLQFLGWIPEDEFIKKSIKKQQSLFELYPSAPSASHYREIAKKLIQIKKSKTADTNTLQLFLPNYYAEVNS